MSLVEWAIGYLKHRDLFQRRIASIEKEGEGLLVKQHDGVRYRCAVEEQLGAALKGEAVVIFTRNTKKNLQCLVEHWSALAAREGLRIVFVNEAKNEKWVIVPSNHQKIADAESLQLGLEAMFSAVPEG